MNKCIFIPCFMSLCLQIQAQNKITGIVKDSKGNGLRYVFVESLQLADAAYTDSLGNFNIKANQGTLLSFKYLGVKDTAVSVAGSTLQVVLNISGSIQNSQALNTRNTVSSQPVSSTIVQGDMSAMSSGSAGALPSMAHKKGSVHGNRYLFDDFVHGFIISPANQVVQNFDYLFDYDKIGGGLLLTSNNKAVTQVSDSEIKSFTLYGPDDLPYKFEMVPAVNKLLYTQVISSGDKYNIYKALNTKFIKSDYVNNGISAHGNDYDEYVDEATYFVMDTQTKQLRKLSLKKKSLKENFAKDADKLNKFMSTNTEDINDEYLTKLGDYLND